MLEDKNKYINVPNFLTLLRFLMIGVMIWFFLNGHPIYAMIVFIVAVLTDFLDGYIARRFNQVTTFGKFLDPIADKVLVLTAMLYLMITMTNRVPIWAVVIVILREFIVTTIRLMAVEKGRVIAASIYGKIKTALTMVALVVLLFHDFGITPWIGDILFYLAILMTLVSGIDYFIKNRNIIFESM